VDSLLEKTDVWNDVLNFVEKRLNKHIFDSWFRPIKCEGRDEINKVLYLRTGQVTKDWVALYYADLLEQAINAAEMRGYAIESEIDTTAPAEDKFSELPDPDSFQVQEQSFAVAAGAEAPAQHKSPTFINGTTNFLDLEPVENSLNPKYTFEKFVVGTSNQFAHAASLAAAETPLQRPKDSRCGN
jgi:chromosomal replication initiator protein